MNTKALLDSSFPVTVLWLNKMIRLVPMIGNKPYPPAYKVFSVRKKIE